MSPRPRKHKKFKGVKLVDNLYPTSSGKSLVYIDPRTKKGYGMGKDPVKANREAAEVNRLLLKNNELALRITGEKDHLLTLAEYIANHYLINVIGDRTYSESWLYNIEVQCNKIMNSELGTLVLNDDHYKQALNLMTDFLNDTGARYSNQLRQRLIDIYKHAISDGHCDKNPAEAKIKREDDPVRAPLSIDEFWQLHDAGELWFKNAIELSLIGEYGGSEVVNIKILDDIRDGYLHTIRQKTHRKNDIAYQRRKIGPWLQEVIDRCKSDNIVSPFLVHRMPKRISKQMRESLPHPTYVRREYLSRTFTKLRDELGIRSDLESFMRPTLHEIRGLSIDEHKKQELDAQLAACHVKGETTDNYLKNRDDIVWTDVNEELDHAKCKR